MTYKIITLTLLLLFPLNIAAGETILLNQRLSHYNDTTRHLSREELNRVGEQIFKNETGGKIENLVVWNNGEDFPSLGIGHFIWFPQGSNAIFEESFPALMNIYKAQNIKLPTLLEQNRYAPWQSQAEFNAAKSRGELNETIQFLLNTKDIQTVFIYQRLQAALEKMKSISAYPDFIEMKFYEVASSQNGLYALIDYVNFKGEGINVAERYQGEGWGLMQVLENMDLAFSGHNKEEIDAAILASFRRSAEQVLTNRVNNAPLERDEIRWLPGWKNRIQTYKPLSLIKKAE